VACHLGHIGSKQRAKKKKRTPSVGVRQYFDYKMLTLFALPADKLQYKHEQVNKVQVQHERTHDRRFFRYL